MPGRADHVIKFLCVNGIRGVILHRHGELLSHLTKDDIAYSRIKANVVAHTCFLYATFDVIKQYFAWWV